MIKAIFTGGIEKMKNYFPIMRMPSIDFFYREIHEMSDRNFERIVQAVCNMEKPPMGLIRWFKHEDFILESEYQRRANIKPALDDLKQNDEIGFRFFRLLGVSVLHIKGDEYLNYWKTINPQWEAACTQDSDEQKKSVLDYGETWLKKLISDNREVFKKEILK